MNAIEVKKAPKALKIPTKTTINLAQRESKKKDVLTVAVGAVLIAALAGLLIYF